MAEFSAITISTYSILLFALHALMQKAFDFLSSKINSEILLILELLNRFFELSGRIFYYFGSGQTTSVNREYGQKIR